MEDSDPKVQNKVVDVSSVRREKYPPVEPYSSGMLQVSTLHSLYWEQCGNPEGYPVLFIHGGPGGGISSEERRFFDPDFYRIILFDQRGAGKSTPQGCLEENTTWDLVDDIEKLRLHLGIEEWQIFGGSWGSCLSITYAQSHPERVTGMIIRGIFLLRKKELDWFYQGGLAAIYPDAWEKFHDLIQEEERDDLIKAYHRLLNHDNPETQNKAAKSWTMLELATSHLLPNEEALQRGEDDAFSLRFARIENHYFKNKGFFPTDSFLLDNIEKIRHIPCAIVQDAECKGIPRKFMGRYDVVCPMMSAWDLHKAWPEAELKIVLDAGHSAYEPGITAELVAANERFKELHKRKL